MSLITIAAFVGIVWVGVVVIALVAARAAGRADRHEELAGQALAARAAHGVDDQRERIAFGA